MGDGPTDVALYKRAREVFEAVLDLDRDGRRARIAESCGDDPVLAELVGRLIAADETYATFDEVTASVEQEDEDRAPERLGRFRVVGELGRGAMGVVYEAEQDLPQRRVAIKTLHPLRRSPRALSQFRVEVNALGRVLHPGIPQVHEVFETAEGVPAMVMERVDGSPLMQAVWLLDHDERARMLARIADAVDHAHRHGVNHRDLKPDNVLVTPSGQPKVLDFGIARLDDVYLPRAGTMAYIAPEQLAGDEPGVASDVYGLGAVGWELMTGEPPVALTAGDDLERIVALKQAPPRHAEGVPEPIVAVLRRALDPEPTARFGSARAMAQALRDAVDGVAEDAVTQGDEVGSAAEGGGEDPPPRPIVAFLAGVAVGALAVWVLWVVWTG